jgi:hypothetical protein
MRLNNLDNPRSLPFARGKIMFATDVCEMADNVLSFVRIFGAQILHILLIAQCGYGSRLQQ